MTAARPTRLCIVNPFQHGGGAEYQIDCLVQTLLESGHYEINYLARHVEPTLGDRGYTVVKIGQSDHIPRFGYTMDAIPLYRALSRIKPDIIYQRVAGGYTGICAFYAQRHAVRFIWHVASDTDVTPDSSLYGRNPVRRFLEKSSVRYAINNAPCIVTQTRTQAQLLAANYGRASDLVVPNFHPFPSETIDKSGSLRVVWVSNFKRNKRPETFIRLAAELQDLPGVRFVIVGAPPSGSGDRQWGDEVLRAIEFAPNIDYVGQQSQTSVNELLARAHLLVNTSIVEGFPNTFIQAWMREVPVVSLGINPDQVLDREGVGFCAGSESELAGVVRRLLTNPQLWSEYAERARAYAFEKHSLRNASVLAEFINGKATNVNIGSRSGRPRPTTT